MTNLQSKRILITVILIAAVFPWPANEAMAWNGEPWGDMSRDEIVSRADEMIDSTWSPLNTIYNFGYGSTYHYFYAGTLYTGEAYSQCPIQDTWAEFYQEVTTTSGGTTYYGNDCSGFVSICWKLGSRYNTAAFESDAVSPGGYVDSLGSKGTCESAGLITGDACNDDYNHIILYLETASGGRMRSMEQTPWTARRRYWYWSSLSPNYRPIRRRQLTDAIEKPTVETRNASDITDTAATLNARITDNGGAAVDERRFDWGTTPSCSDGWTAAVTVNGNNFSYRLANLQPDTVYYFRAWAHNSAGWSRGNVLSFRTETAQTLSITLSASTQTGTTPLMIDLTAAVSGTATGTINYTFYRNRSDDGTNITYPNDFKIDGRNPDGTGGTVKNWGIATGYSGGTTFTVYNVCNYTTPGTYTAKVIAERGSAPPAEARVTITVAAPTAGITIVSGTPVDFGAMGFDASKVTTTAVVIKNTGSGSNQTYSLKLANPSGWTAVSTDPGMDKYRLSAAFDSNGNLTWDPTKHSLSTTSVAASTTKFAGDQTGTGVPYNQNRNLYLKMETPSKTISPGSKTVSVTITATVD